MQLSNKEKILRIPGLTLLMLLFAFVSYQKSYAQQRLKIIDYNVEDGMAKDTTGGKMEFADWFKAQDPDIVGLEELNDFTPHKLKTFAAKYQNRYVVLIRRKKYKVGITSKYPITDVHLVTDNMTHGFILAQIKGYHIVVAHLDPHNYVQRRKEIKIILSAINARRKDSDEKWIFMGDLNSVSPLDRSFYARDDRKREFQMNAAKKRPGVVHNLVNDSLDFQVQQAVLNDGFIDSYHFEGHRPKSSEMTARIDYIYVSKNLEGKIVSADFIRDKFTQTHSDHHPMCMILKHS